MKRCIITGWLCVLAALGANFAAEPITVAVLDFEWKDESVREYGPRLASLVTAALSENAEIYTVERAELDKALGEQELGLSGTVSADTAAKVGHLTGAKVLVTGRVFKVDKEIQAVTKIMSTETSRVFGQTAKALAGASISDLANALATKISATLTERKESMLASGQSPEQKIEKMLAGFKVSSPRAIEVKLPEVHYGSPANDPAAQTELQTILQKAGFKIVDEKSDTRPAIVVEGEAFSAHGLRRGNLHSCKARIEIKAREAKSGEILWADRQTSVAVDITEQTAAKAALENAAREIAIRLLPNLNKP